MSEAAVSARAARGAQPQASEREVDVVEHDQEIRRDVREPARSARG